MHHIDQILAIFEGFRMVPSPNDQYTNTGKAILRDKIMKFVANNQPISWVMLGFPMKSTNSRDKVLGVLPDLAEQVAITNFSNFNKAIKMVYPPGIRMNIASDGLIFNDLLNTFDRTVWEYNDMVEDMAKGVPLYMYNLTHFYTQGRLPDKRNKLMEQFGISDVELERRIMFDPDVNTLYRGMIHFMEAELATKSYDSRNQLHKAAKQLARDMMLRNEAYSAIVNREFADSIRLSMHPSINNGKKYSFQMIPGDPAMIWTSPWHCALVVGPNGFETIHKKDAVEQGLELVYQDNRPYNFVRH